MLMIAFESLGTLKLALTSIYKEFRRAEVLGQVANQQLRPQDAAELVRLSYRQTKRLWKRYREEGLGGLHIAARAKDRTVPSRRSFAGR